MIHRRWWLVCSAVAFLTLCILFASIHA